MKIFTSPSRRLTTVGLTAACALSLSMSPAFAADQAAVKKAIDFLGWEKPRSYFAIFVCGDYRERVNWLIDEYNLKVTTPLSAKELKQVETADYNDRITAIGVASKKAGAPEALDKTQKEQFDHAYNSARAYIEKTLHTCRIAE